MEEVAIAVSCDNNYVKYFSVLLESIKKTSNKNRHYKIYLLNDNLIPFYKSLLDLQLLCSKNIKLEVINSSIFTKGIKFSTCKQWTKETFYRLFLPQILKEDKVLYLDVDMLVLRDVAELFDTDLGDYYLGATFNFAHLYAANNNIQDRGYFIPDYFNKVLNIDDIYDYFNAGMTLMNLRKMREDNLDKIFLDEINSGFNYLYVDQDILNKTCHRNYLKLPSQWNIYNSFNPLNTAVHICNDFEKAINDPYIIHFAGGKKRKVWHNLTIKHALKWWRVALNSVFFFSILNQYIKFNKQNFIKLILFYWRFRL